MTPSVARDRPALAADPLDEHLVGLEHVAVDLEAPAVELLELARARALAHVAQRRAELRAEHGQVRLHAQLGRLDVAELDLLDAQLVRDLVGVRRARRGAPATTSRRSGWRSFSCEVDARLAAELDDAPHLGDLGEQRRVGLARLRPAGEVHRRRPVAATRFRHRWSARNGITGATRAATARARTRASRNAASSTS